jgi:hypothetical protein
MVNWCVFSYANVEMHKMWKNGLSMKEKKPKRFRENKEAFDQTLASYRSAKDTGVGAAVWANGGGTVTKNPASPSLMDFRADVELIVESIISDEELLWFWAVYGVFDSTDDIERGVFSEKMLGQNKSRSWEQRIGAAFVKFGVYPLAKYLLSIRKPRV